jgi:hypothetical protein
MDTKPLERFAAQARRDLIAAVDAQATAVLSPGSVARSERAHVVKRLEDEIAAHGRPHVIDKVAYTWFNRIIALRFMDARGYTDAGVVSPAQGQSHGQPEILTDAKRGNLDADVATNKNTAAAIIGLLDGTRRSTDAEGEAYALLLTEYCRHWHKSMPFMFEGEGDYTELLVPTGLLADGAILSRAREVLTEDVCDDVEVIGWLYQFYISERKDEVFAGFKKNRKAGAEEIPAATQLFTPHWIVRYLVENSLGRLWLLNQPTSRLADRMDYYVPPVDEETDFLKISGPEELTVIDPACGSGHMLTYSFDLLYAIYEEKGYAPSAIPGLILNHNLHGTEIDRRAGSLAAFALTMKARAKDRRFFSKDVVPNVCVIEPVSFGLDELDFLLTSKGDGHAEELFWNQFADADTLGSLIQPDELATASAASALDKFSADGDIFHSRTLERARRVVALASTLGRTYSVVVANPPYMGAKNMNGRLAMFAKENFPDTKSDLFAMFIERCVNLTADGGATAMITMQSWMFVSSFEKLRARVVASNPPVTMVHLGERAFDSIGGAVVSTTAFVLERGGEPTKNRIYIRIVKGENERAKRGELRSAVMEASHPNRYLASARQFLEISGAPIAYWLSESMRRAFAAGTRLGMLTEPRQGMATAENGRFVRQWWEVDHAGIVFDCTSREEAQASGAKWFPYNKAGGARKWWGHQDSVVNWLDDGRAIRAFGTEGGGRPRSRVQNVDLFFKRSISWSRISTLSPSFRMYPEGFIFDVAGGSIFPCDETMRRNLIGLLNSSVAERALNAIAPTINFTEGNIGAIPVLPLPDGTLQGIIDPIIEASRKDWDDFETSWGFRTPSVLGCNGNSLRQNFEKWLADNEQSALSQQRLESENNRVTADAYGVSEEVGIEVPLCEVSLSRNVEYIDGPGRKESEYRDLALSRFANEFVSYAVGCMFGRYSPDEPGLILAGRGKTLQDFLARVPSPSFRPDTDNVIPFVDDGWFEDDIVERFRQFLRVAFGEEHFEGNLRFVEESLGVKTLRDYFITKAGKSKFNDDHVQRYKKRPIYWMFSSPKGSFNALIYMHRYNPSTVSTVLNEYLREYRAKLEVALTNAEQAAAAGSVKDQKEADRLRKVLAELRDYEHDVLYPLATQQIAIDLDDGVKANYPKFYPALKKIAGLEAAE